MPNVSNFGTQTDNAVVQGTVTDRAMVIPDIPPQGLMSVGPRVTPHFVKPSLWSALTTYHFFDAVHDTAGASYVAIKPEVPAGTELTDEGYWFLWADPNSQFADLSELVKTFNGRITQNTNDIAQNTTDIAQNKTDIKRLSDYVTEKQVTPEMFGAIGNGTADDTEAVKAAFNSGKTVKLRGKYKCTSDITITQANQLSIEGIDVNESGFIFVGSAHLDIRPSKAFELRMTRFAITGSGYNNMLLEISNINNIYASEVAFSESTGTLVNLSSCGIVYFDKCIFAGSNKPNVYMQCDGIQVNNTYPIYITNSNIWNIKTFITGDAKRCFIENNWIEGVYSIIKTNYTEAGCVFNMISNVYQTTYNDTVDYTARHLIDISPYALSTVTVSDNLIINYTQSHHADYINIRGDSTCRINFENNTFFSILSSDFVYINLDATSKAICYVNFPLNLPENICNRLEQVFSISNNSFKPRLLVLNNTNANMPGSLYYEKWPYINVEGTVKSLALATGISIKPATSSNIQETLNNLIDACKKAHVII